MQTPNLTPLSLVKHNFVWLMGIFHLSPTSLQPQSCTVSGFLKRVSVCPCERKAMLLSIWTAAQLFPQTHCQRHMECFSSKPTIRPHFGKRLVHTAPNCSLLSVYCSDQMAEQGLVDYSHLSDTLSAWRWHLRRAGAMSGRDSSRMVEMSDRGVVLRSAEDSYHISAEAISATTSSFASAGLRSFHTVK